MTTPICDGEENMNTCTWEQQILLDLSGELTGQERLALQQHLEHCEPCRRFQADYARLSQEYAATSRSHPMPEALKQRLITAAGELTPKAQKHTILWIHAAAIRPLLALAALLVLCMSGLLIYRHVTAAAPVTLAQQTPATVDIEEIALQEEAWEEEFIALEQSFAQVDQEWKQSDRAWLPEEETELLARDLLEMEKSS